MARVRTCIIMFLVATTYAITPAQAVQLGLPASTMVQCQSQTGGNGNWQYLNQGQTITVGCTSAAPSSTVMLNAHATVLVKCGTPGPNNSWTSLAAGQQTTISCGSGSKTPTPTPSVRPTPTPSPTFTPTPLPSGVPTPPAIPPVPTLIKPTTVGPGTHGVVGNGITDDTAAWQAALNAGDVIVSPGIYAIAGNLSIPTGRNIFCLSGAIFLDTQTTTTHMFGIGYSPSSLGNNSIVGCTFQGTDYPAGSNNFANYHGGIGGYSELFEVTSGWGTHTDSVLIENNAFLDGQGDDFITYSPCGTANTGSPCNGGAPGTEGPSNITVYNNTFTHCAQPGLHFNGGQTLHAAN